MFTRAASLRYWLLVAMMGSAVVGLAAAAFLFSHVETSQERAEDAARARQEARTIALQVRSGDAAHLGASQELLGNDRFIVYQAGRIIFKGPPRPGRTFEAQVEARFPGGLVRFTDYSSPGSSTTPELTLITAGVLALVIASAIIAATLVTRAVRRPVQRAIAAAERVSHGDFTARMGTSGPQELVKLGAAFDDMAARLEQADRDQRRFLADIAHEIATPMNAVSGFGLALADGAAQDEQQQREAKSLIEAQTGRLADLLSDLRELTQLDIAGGVRVSPLALRPWAERLVASFRPVARNANVDLQLASDDCEVPTDAGLLEMIASNLLSNAIRYTPSGGSVHIESHCDGKDLVLRVSDSGIGIPPEHQKRIFERLYRVDATRDRATGGSGLGLAIVERAVRTLGGQIELMSSPGEGSTFRVILPAQGWMAVTPTKPAPQIPDSPTLGAGARPV
jgi:signal transduction histidine kinase